MIAMSDTEVQQFEADQFLQLLTDALRAGPGSPQWHEAVTQLRVSNPGEMDDYKLLMTAREHLESGKEYRSIRPGPGFTRKVMEGVEAEASPVSSNLPSANLLAVLGALGILAVLAVLVIILSHSTPNPTTPADLENANFLATWVQADFSQDIPMEWIRFGQAPVLASSHDALRAGFDKSTQQKFVTGGIYLGMPPAADQSFAFEATIKLRKATTNIELQLFVADDPHSKSPFVVDLLNGQLSVFLPDGKVAGQQRKVTDSGGVIHVLIKLDSRFAVVETDDHRILYSGPHNLPSTSRFPGLKFISKGPESGLEDVTVQTLRMLKP
jgi:hypothetical protein